MGRGEDGRREAGEATGHLHKTEGASEVVLVIRATTHHMVIVFTHLEAEDTTTHPGVEEETTLPGVEEESTLLGEEGEVVEVGGIPQLRKGSKVRVTSALKCCKIHGRSSGETQEAGVGVTRGITKGKGKVARCYRKKKAQVRM